MRNGQSKFHILLVLALAACASESGDRSSGRATTTQAGTLSAKVLFRETFDDGSLTRRGWYDLPGNGPTTVTSAEHAPGTAHSLEVRFGAGQIAPTPPVSGRHAFQGTTSVYVSYWVKYSSNWVGSGKPYHPHEIYLLTNEDAAYAGPASTFLTAYIEHNYQARGGFGVLGIQDAKNIDAAHISQDLAAVTEKRAVAGCNGSFDSAPSDCYQNGSAYLNGKTWTSAEPAFAAAQGSGYKNNWHRVEAYFRLNSIQSGVGQRDGVAQYWVDGRLLIDRQGVVFRTGAHPNMQFNQFLFAPYIGDGSPVSQTMWIGDLVVATERVQ